MWRQNRGATTHIYMILRIDVRKTFYSSTFGRDCMRSNSSAPTYVCARSRHRPLLLPPVPVPRLGLLLLLLLLRDYVHRNYNYLVRNKKQARKSDATDSLPSLRVYHTHQVFYTSIYQWTNKIQGGCCALHGATAVLQQYVPPESLWEKKISNGGHKQVMEVTTGLTPTKRNVRKN